MEILTGIFENKGMMRYFIFYQNNLLLARRPEGNYSLPECDGAGLPVALPAEEFCYDMTEHCGGIGSLAFGVSTGDFSPVSGACEWVELRSAWELLSDADYAAAAHASTWVYWERTNRFCSVCGTPLQRFLPMGKRCPRCEAEHFPQLAPAVIVRIKKEDRILLVRARTFKRYMFGLVAGFLEGGETLEEGVVREVREETGLEIKNIRYFGSQPWPYPSGVMIGFTADYLSGEIKLVDGELFEADFFDRDHLPPIPSKMSIARRLIDDWLGQ